MCICSSGSVVGRNLLVFAIGFASICPFLGLTGVNAQEASKEQDSPKIVLNLNNRSVAKAPFCVMKVSQATFVKAEVPAVKACPKVKGQTLAVKTQVKQPVAKQAASQVASGGKIHAVLTAYSSTVDQTDSTPFITANGTYVRDGIVANNMLPFGTKVKIPALYGDKIFSVEDRMHPRVGTQHFDIWFPSRAEAKSFGVKYAYIEVVK